MNLSNTLKSNPLGFIWNIISNISGVVGLVSLTDDFIAWKKFIPNLIEAYQKIIYYPFRVFEIDISDALIDYLFLGSLVATAFIKAVNLEQISAKFTNTFGYSIVLRVFIFICCLLFWFLVIIWALMTFLTKSERSKFLIRFLQWLGAIILVFMMVLIYNTI